MQFIFHFIFTPIDLKNLSFSAIASQFFLANFYFTFFSDTSYFANNAKSEPFIHLWSLAVEEQFYLLFPSALFLFYKHFRTAYLFLIVTVI